MLVQQIHRCRLACSQAGAEVLGVRAGGARRYCQVARASDEVVGGPRVVQRGQIAGACAGCSQRADHQDGTRLQCAGRDQRHQASVVHQIGFVEYGVVLVVVDLGFRDGQLGRCIGAGRVFSQTGLDARSYQGGQWVDLSTLAGHLFEYIGLFSEDHARFGRVEGGVGIGQCTGHHGGNQGSRCDLRRCDRSGVIGQAVGPVGPGLGRDGLTGIAEVVGVEIHTHHGVLDGLVHRHGAGEGDWCGRRRWRWGIATATAAATARQGQEKRTGSRQGPQGGAGQRQGQGCGWGAHGGSPQRAKKRG